MKARAGLGLSKAVSILSAGRLRYWLRFDIFSISMKSAVFLLLLFCLMSISCGSGPAANSRTANGANTVNITSERKTVLVELFTSEGCPNCPPADKQLAFLETQQPVAGADVITLGYHVDYFNDRGWKDEYSDANYTKRQQLYAARLGAQGLYTPQMIVDGQTQFVGNNPAKANEAITRAIATDRPQVSATASGSTANVSVTGIGRHMTGTAVLAIAEDGLVSQPNTGSNRGKKLEHISVVRGLVPFGKISEQAGEFQGSVQLPTNPAWKQANVRYIIYLQEDMSGRIIASGRVKAS